MLGLTNLSFDSSGFCWILSSERQNVYQTSYRVQVAEMDDFKRLLWDSGEVNSDQSCFVPYAGGTLPSCKTLFWRVRIVDNHGDDSGWCESQQIMVGPALQEWQARFITPETIQEVEQSKGKLLRRSFTVNGEIESATVYATALGLYELFINGASVTNAVLTPGWTEYHKRLLYQTWDVTHLIRIGENAVGAMLGAGWYKGDLASWTGQRSIYGNRTGLLMQLEIRYTNGQQQTVVTDTDWRCSDGPILYSELYHGEVYDARLEKPGWSEPGYDDIDWICPELLERSLSTLYPQDGPSVLRMKRLPVQNVIITPKGETLLDFGQNISGWVRFSVRGSAGEVVCLRHAEVLDKDGNFYTENMRSAKNEIIYTLCGREEEIFEPHFTFQGFRYVQIVSYPDEIQPDSFEAIVIHSNMERTGHFMCSHTLLNQLHSNILWGLKGNFIDVPTDCPQRDERLGWTGDAQIFCRTSTYLMDTRNFFIKWLRDLRMAQFENGGVPFVVPDILTGKFPEGDIISNAESVAGWGDAAVICPWTLWLAYGDKSILNESYDSMKAWVEYIHKRASGGLLWNTDYQLGDWVALDAEEDSYFGATSTDLIATAFYAKCVEILAKVAEILGEDADSERFRALRYNIGKAYASEFFLSGGQLISSTQTSHILSLMFELTPEEYKERTVQGLLRLLADNNGHLTTGFLGTPYFCQVLADNGCLEEAYRLLLKEDYPSWLYQVTKGATTVWEHWDGIKPDGSMWSPDMNSFNHYAYGSIGEFMYRVIGGIDICEEMPGYKRIMIIPHPGDSITWANTSVLTPYGEVSTYWKVAESMFFIKVKVPHNTKATVILPDGSKYETGSGHYEYSCIV